MSTPRGAGCCGAEETGFAVVPGVSEIEEPCLGFEEQAGCGLLECGGGTQVSVGLLLWIWGRVFIGSVALSHQR